MQRPTPAVMNQFNLGLKTEFTGLNFPENAATDTQNCEFNRIGNVNRRPGIDYELNFALTSIDPTLKAINNYTWKNVGGDGATQIQVTQIGGMLRFYRSSTATIASPLSNQLLGSTVDITGFIAAGGSFDATQECQFTDGNGYLFVFHPSCDPFYCTYTAGTIAANGISISIRDFVGIPETIADNQRPPTLSTEHSYNLSNQGWTAGSPWTGVSSSAQTLGTGSKVFTLSSQSNTTVANGNLVSIVYSGIAFSAGAGFIPTTATMTGNVTSYITPFTSITINVTSYSDSRGGGFSGHSSTEITTNGSTPAAAALSKINTGYINTWFTAIGNNPSNADVWWLYKNSSGVFDPGATINNISLSSGPANKGGYILQAFNQQRSAASSIAGITDVTTTARPRTGTWFQGRVWFAGVDASFPASGDAPFSTWTETIYFSQIVVKTDQFGKCYQTNDPTSQNLFGLLPTDGGTITIQGCGSIYKLFPIQNGLLVFAANGVWFITGSSGIGFTANDYTINRISAIQSISSSSFVDVRGTPMWWNEEGIYTVAAGQGDEGLNYGSARGAAYNAGLKVEPLTFTTIQTYYQNIPLTAKKHAKGIYDPLNWVVKWIFKSVEETDVTSRYQYDSVLVLNTTIQSFYPWSLSTTAGVPYIHGITYVQSPGGSTAPSPILKYIVSNVSNQFTYAEERDTTNLVDWHSSGINYNYVSYFVTGYGIKGLAQHKFQVQYIWLYLNNPVNASYKMQGIWDYAVGDNSGKFTNLERTDINENVANFGIVHRRHVIRGRGLVLQFKVVSVDGKPFDIIGWSVDERVNQGA